MAMDEIQDKQKDLKQIVDVAGILYERSTELQSKCDEQNLILNQTANELQRTSDELM